MMPYERFDAWRVCNELAVEVYRVTRAWPKSELYGLTSQVRRAALSAPANLAEGSARRGAREFARFTDRALGSLSELSYLLSFAEHVGVMAADDRKALDALRERAGQLTWKLLRALRTSGKAR